MLVEIIGLRLPSAVTSNAPPIYALSSWNARLSCRLRPYPTATVWEPGGIASVVKVEIRRASVARVFFWLPVN